MPFTGLFLEKYRRELKNLTFPDNSVYQPFFFPIQDGTGPVETVAAEPASFDKINR